MNSAVVPPLCTTLTRRKSADEALCRARGTTAATGSACRCAGRVTAGERTLVVPPSTS